MIPLPRGRLRAPRLGDPGKSWSGAHTSAYRFKLISFGLIACFVELLLVQGQPIVIAVCAAVAIATCSGAGRGLARRQYGHLLA